MDTKIKFSRILAYAIDQYNKRSYISFTEPDDGSSEWVDLRNWVHAMNQAVNFYHRYSSLPVRELWVFHDPNYKLTSLYEEGNYDVIYFTDIEQLPERKVEFIVNLRGSQYTLQLYKKGENVAEIN